MTNANKMFLILNGLFFAVNTGLAVANVCTGKYYLLPINILGASVAAFGIYSIARRL